MNQATTISALNNLLSTLHRSFASYLNYAAPWQHAGNERAVTTLADIVRDQQSMVQRVAELVTQRGYVPRWGEYPMEFTSAHDLSFDYLLTELARYQRADIAQIELLAERITGDRQALELAQEALGEARAHLELLQELIRTPASA